MAYSAVVVWGNYAYMVGGFDETYNASASVIRLDLSNPLATWDTTPTDLTTPMYGHCAVVYGNTLFIFGGVTTNKTHALNLLTNTWSDAAITDMPNPRFYSQAVLYGSKVYIIGGADSSNGLLNYALDLTTPTGSWSWTTIPDVPALVYGHSCCMVGSKLYLLGGMVGLTPSQYVYVLNMSKPSTGWQPMAPLTVARKNGTSQPFNNSIYFIGGYSTVMCSNTWVMRFNDNPNDKSQLTAIGRTVMIKHSRYGYDTNNGRPMIILSRELDNINRITTLGLWG
jgi:N-acetylneuraminic acid mutarotase